ncbi:MAG: MDR family MFS transporter [Dehalococcoidia bacterium]|nr:MDR family MFS transporter [Dehalococcoidia bacterium]
MTQSENETRRPDARQSLRATVSRKRLVMILVGIMLGMLLAALDQTIVGTAMPRVIAELNGLEHYAWVATSYMLASTVVVPIYGKLSDIYGRRPFFIGGMVLFLIGSALSGASQDMVQLIVFRAIQGFGAGALMPISQAIVGDIFPPAQRAKWQGIMMATFGFATIVGPTAGGWITDNLGWRWVFYVNLPVGLLAILTAGFTLPREIRFRQHRIDYLGATALVGCALPLLLAFSWAGSIYQWMSPQIVGLLAFAATMCAVFLLIERRASEPIISLSLFKNRIFSVSVIASFLVSGGMFGATMYLPLFVQGVIGVSATNSGAVLTPMMLGFVVSTIVGGQLISRTGRYKLIALTGLAIGTVGMLLLSQMDVDTTQGLVMRNMAITGLGLGVAMTLFTIVVQNAFPMHQLGEVTASLQFFRSIGGTISIAVLGSVMINRFHDAFQSNLPGSLRQVVPADKLVALQNPQVLLSPGAMDKLGETFASLGPQGQELSRQLMEAIRLSLASAISGLFVIGACIMALSLIATIFLREIPLRKTHQHPLDEGQADARDSGEAAPGVVGID